MRYRTATLLLLLLLPASATSQAFVRVGAGATASSYFLKDFLVEPVNARQSLAPTAQVLAGWRMSNGIRIGVEGRYALGTWEVVDRGFTDDLGSLKVLTLAAFIDGPLAGALRWEAVAGVLKYQPAAEVGPFSAGAPSPWMIGGGASWTRALNAGLDLVVSARYDYHGFQTSRLDVEGYSSRQSVHRAALILAVERGF